MADRNLYPEVPPKSKTRRGPKFPTSDGTAIKVTPGAGGHNLGTATHCESKRAAPNVKTSY
jgi:hypothetical protein